MNLNQWFNQGMSIQEYVESMEKHKANLSHVYEHFRLLHTEDLKDIKQAGLRVIVLTEDWCGDAMVNMPILMRLAEETNMELSIVLRDSNLELMDQYLTNGRARSIPIFIFINTEGKEVTKWGPRAPIVQDRVNDVFAALPEKDSVEYEAKWKEAIQQITNMYRNDETVWQEVYISLSETIRKAI